VSYADANQNWSEVDDLLDQTTSLFRMKQRESSLYQFKITLQDVKPPVWRRIQTPAGYSFWDLHVAIQNAMGWDDTHLHEFHILEPKTGAMATIGIPDDGEFGEDREIVPSWEPRISDFFSAEIPSARYVYDFGDDWNHAIVFEEKLQVERPASNPICVDGQGACPPENCGGSFGYAEFLRAIKKPGSPRGGELLEWVGGSFNPKHFDVKEVEFDDPAARWAWAFNESVALENDITSMQSTPRKPDRQGRVSFPLPPAQCGLIRRYCVASEPAIQEQFQAATLKGDLAIVKLDGDELKSLVAQLGSAAMKCRSRLDRLILSALRQHFMQMDSLIRSH
jgi:hypothetical protein